MSPEQDNRPEPEEYTVTVNMRAEVVQMLGMMAELTGLSRTQLINDAVHFYSMVVGTLTSGGEVMLSDGISDARRVDIPSLNGLITDESTESRDD